MEVGRRGRGVGVKQGEGGDWKEGAGEWGVKQGEGGGWTEEGGNLRGDGSRCTSEE